MTEADQRQSPAGSDPIGGEPDTTFRVSLPEAGRPIDNLQEYYRQTLVDLLEIVRFSFQGKPVLVDGFAFRNRPDRVIPLLGDEQRGAP